MQRLSQRSTQRSTQRRRLPLLGGGLPSAVLALPLLAALLTPQQVRAQLLDGVPALAEDSVGSEAFVKDHGAAPRWAHDRQRVEELLSRMTIEEKVGQMTQLDIFMVTDGEHQEIELNDDKLRQMIVELGVGSILNVNGEALGLDRWHRMVGRIQEEAAKSRLGIPVLYGIDSIHGANYVEGATLFPQPLGMAATFRPELLLEGSRITARETRWAAIPWNFSPVLDVGRHPAWPRFYETFGESPYLASVMGVAAVRGYEGDSLATDGTVASSLKHYLGYSGPVTGHDRTPSEISERTLRQIYVPPFRAAIDAGARTIMVNSGEINGIPVHANRRLLTDLLRNELGFDGVVVTDWEDVKKLETLHKVAADEKEATRMSIEAGIDMSMVPRDTSFATLLVELVREGAVSEARLDESVRRILALKDELGLFDDPMLGAAAAGEIGSRAHRSAALQAARESVVLLENADGLLPLDGSRRVLLTGPTADSLEALNNGWTYTWQGVGASNYPTGALTIAEALGQMAEDVHHVPTPFGSEDPETDRAAAVAAAAGADVVVLCLGEASYTETPGNIEDLRLPSDQLDLARALAATGKPVVLVLVEGRPRVLDGIADAAGAVVLANNPGMEGGQALAEVLLGRVNPSGRLPYTYPRHTNGLRTYDHKHSSKLDAVSGFEGFDPQWTFGDGLSYTTFELSDLELDRTEIGPGHTLDVTVTVTNTGDRAGARAVLLFLTDEFATVTPADRRLRSFSKVHLEPGQSKTVAFTLGPDDFEFIGRDNRPTIEPGTFVVRVGELTQTFEITAP